MVAQKCGDVVGDMPFAVAIKLFAQRFMCLAVIVPNMSGGFVHNGVTRPQYLIEEKRIFAASSGRTSAPIRRTPQTCAVLRYPFFVAAHCQ